MPDIRRPVVVGVDGSPASLGAVRWAVDEAARHSVPLKVVHALGRPGLLGFSSKEQRIALDAAVEARRWVPGTEVTTTTAVGSPAGVLRDQSHRAGLVVVGSRGHGGFSGLLVGSVSAHLAAYAHCPLLVVHRGENWAGQEAQLPSHAPIVVGDDGSAPAQHALGLAFAEAAARRVPLVAVRVWQQPEQRRRRRPVDPVGLAAAEERALSTGVEPWRIKYPDVEVRLVVREGGVAAELIQAATQALMVVLGARGRGGFEELLLGSVTHQVLHHAASPVLVDRVN